MEGWHSLPWMRRLYHVWALGWAVMRQEALPACPLGASVLAYRLGAAPGGQTGQPGPCPHSRADGEVPTGHVSEVTLTPPSCSSSVAGGNCGCDAPAPLRWVLARSAPGWVCTRHTHPEPR